MPLYTSAQQAITALMRSVPDFPEPGVLFRDLTPVLANATGFQLLTDHMADVARTHKAELIAGLDARGFVFGAAVAKAVGTGCLAVRKAGKLPPPVLREEYALEYGTAALELPGEGIDVMGVRVLIVDDVLATGGTVNASRALLERAGAHVVGTSVVLELEALGGRSRLSDMPIDSILSL
ncbi:adenine phosphoribosyltransferase [Stomatohabitans albus]|uniref:adenine phosphoribosyltransferase n=1 Tax=Stomatohabitans albus TaxID=3110766 RepID=UPI00300D1D87